MDLMEQIILWLQQLPPGGVLALMFFIAYLENIFPPAPSDVLLVFAGTLIGVGTVGFVPSLVMSTLGSTLGFMTAYFVGRYFEQHAVSGKFGRLLPVGTIHQVEKLFRLYGYGVIVANRFLAGTRAIVSFFAGMSRMNLTITTILCAVSAGLWNCLLLYLGMIFAKNWRKAADYLQLYSTIISVVVIGLLIIFVVIYLRRRRNNAGTTANHDGKAI